MASLCPPPFFFCGRWDFTQEILFRFTSSKEDLNYSTFQVVIVDFDDCTLEPKIENMDQMFGLPFASDWRSKGHQCD